MAKVSLAFTRTRVSQLSPENSSKSEAREYSLVPVTIVIVPVAVSWEKEPRMNNSCSVSFQIWSATSIARWSVVSVNDVIAPASPATSPTLFRTAFVAWRNVYAI